MKDYYQVLRISRTANADEVRRAYRRLAVLFHPDKNTSNDALRLFQEINEAHEVLSDPVKRSNYDLLLQGGGLRRGPEPVQQTWHRDPAYRRRQQAGYRPQKPGPSEKLLAMLHLLRFLRTASLVGLSWCALLVIDYTLPFRESNEKVLPEGYRSVSWQLHHEPNVIVTEKQHEFPVPFKGVAYFPVGSYAKVVTSRLLNVLVRVESGDGSYVVDSLASIYQNMMLVPIILLIVSAAGLLVKKGIEFRFNLLVSIGILLIFNFAFLMFSIL